MKQSLVRCAESGCPLLGLLLIPLSWLYGLVAALRRQAYRRGLLPTVRLPVPVVVVGNITAGGSGKTPLVIWLARQLVASGWRPGIISRGYGGQGRQARPVDAASDPALVGDEPVLIVRATGLPVWVAARRVEAGLALLGAHPEVDVLLADDGLQHYALARDMEIAVVDAVRRFGNGRLLPAGPLRERPSRLTRVDAVVMNGPGDAPEAGPVPRYAMALRPSGLRRLGRADGARPPEALAGNQVHAVAGIGHPERFFQTLRDLGMLVIPHAFADHHPYTLRDLPDGTLVMTAKDAVKCEAFPLADAWVLEVDAVVEGRLNEKVSERLAHWRRA